MPRIPRPHRDDYLAYQTLSTRWQDNDQYGHMNNVVHYALIDTAVTQWQMSQKGFDVLGTSKMLMVVESGCQYFAEAKFPDIIHAGLAISKIGTSSWTTEVALFRNQDQEAFAKGFFAQVQVDVETGRPHPLNEEMRRSMHAIYAQT